MMLKSAAAAVYQLVNASTALAGLANRLQVFWSVICQVTGRLYARSNRILEVKKDHLFVKYGFV